MAAYESKIPLTIIEKDYWVVWALDRLFSLPDLREHLTFKGGTSLSKVYGVIERFSEDIDLSIEKNFFGFDENNSPETVSSRKKQKVILEKLAEACKLYVQGKMQTDLQASISRELATTDGWRLELEESDPDGQSLRFEYPSITPRDGYIHAFVKIELGARSEHWPVSEQKVRSYAKETFSYCASP